MPAPQILYPLFTMALLPVIILILLALFRLKAIMQGEITFDTLKIPGTQKEPLLTVRMNNNLSNLFHFPVLFYVACVLIIVFVRVDEFYIYFAWTYVASRYLHSAIHILYNNVLQRFSIYLLSSLVLMAIWIKLFLDLTASYHGIAH